MTETEAVIYTSHCRPGQEEVNVLSTADFSGLKGNGAKDQAPIKQAEGSISPCWVYHSEGQKLSHKASVRSLASVAVGTPASFLRHKEICV